MPKFTVPTGAASEISRRHFLKRSSLALGAASLTGPFIVRGQNLNERIGIGVIGADGKGSSDTDDAAACGGDIVALCDVDETRLAKRAEKYPKAKRYLDYRKMLEELGSSIDAVTVSTPDHVHAPASVMAMKMGKHCFCQKPLTHSVYEARTMRELAKAKKLATQMGNQGSANPGLRRSVEVIQAGVIGKPLELHVWSNRPIWPQGIERPSGQDEVPDSLDWDLWLGPAPARPFKKGVYHPFAWRGWKDFGTGALGDMACHTVNMPFRALKMGYPTVVECEEVSETTAETYPKTSRIRFEFPSREGLPPLKFWWYDGNPGEKSVSILRPRTELTGEIIELDKELRKVEEGKLPASGCLIIGDKGRIFSPDDYGAPFFVMLQGETKLSAADKHEACTSVPESIPRSPGHMREWFNAMKGGSPAYSNFDIAAYLTEIILLGCVALNVGVGKKLDWDGPNMRAKNTRAADPFVRREYRKGWEV